MGAKPIELENVIWGVWPDVEGGYRNDFQYWHKAQEHGPFWSIEFLVIMAIRDHLSSNLFHPKFAAMRSLLGPQDAARR